jgi:hypothetical protein
MAGGNMTSERKPDCFVPGAHGHDDALMASADDQANYYPIRHSASSGIVRGGC